MRYRCARGGNTFSLDEHLPRRDDSAIDYIEQPRGMQHDGRRRAAGFTLLEVLVALAVVGLGYIGLPTAVSLATGGLEVTGVDVNRDIVERVNRGETPFAEPDLSVAVSGAVAMGRLRAQQEMPQADAYVIAVPTPFTGDHQADLSYITAAAEAIADVLRGGEVIVLESTAPPGTTRRVSELIAARRPDLHLPHVPDVPPDVHVAHCPERVLPGRIVGSC